MTQATMARPHAPRRSLPPVSVIVLFVVGALLCVAMAFALQDEEMVPRVTVENPSTLPVNVDVRGAPDGSRLILSTVPAGSTVNNLDVLEQGDEWTFGFSSGGIDGGTVTVSREACRRWLAARGSHRRRHPPADHAVRPCVPLSRAGEARDTLVALGASLLAAGLLARLGRSIGLPTIPLFMIAGLLFGPNTPGISSSTTHPTSRCSRPSA